MAKWDSSRHPRDSRGRFAKSGAARVAAALNTGQRLLDRLAGPAVTTGRPGPTERVTTATKTSRLRATPATLARQQLSGVRVSPALAAAGRARATAAASPAITPSRGGNAARTPPPRAPETSADLQRRARDLEERAAREPDDVKAQAMYLESVELSKRADAARQAERLAARQAEEAANPTPAVVPLTPAQRRVVNVVREIAAASGRHDAWVSLADVRERLDRGMSRAEQNQVLRALNLRPDVSIEEETNQKALTRRDRAAAVVIGDRAQHVIRVAPSAEPTVSPAPASPAPARRSASAAKAVASDQAVTRAAASITEMIEAAKRGEPMSRDAVRSAVAGMTVAQLKQLYVRLVGSQPPRVTKPRLVDSLANDTVGWRLDYRAVLGSTS